MANFNFNKVIIGGRITADPELKTTASGISVTTFTVAVNRNFKPKNGEEPQADFLTVTAWRQTAEFVTRYFRKASSICVVGSLQTRSWVDQNGQKRYATDIVADEAFFVDSKGDASRPPAAESGRGGEGAQQAAQAKPQPTVLSTPGAAAKFDQIGDDEELPF